MMNEIELAEYFDRLGVPPAGRRLVEKARRDSPVRKVQSRLGNVITEFQSRKMNRVIATESRTVEYPAVVQYEHDKTVLEFYPQPAFIDVHEIDPSGRKTGRITYAPDYLILRVDGVSMEEWRPETTMQKKAKSNPGRFERTNSGWRFPLMESKLNEMGIGFRIRTDEEHPKIFVQNLIFLVDYLSPNAEPVDAKTLKEIKRCFEREASFPLANLISIAQGVTILDDADADEIKEPAIGAATTVAKVSFTPDHVYKAIADGQLAFDLYQECLSETHAAIIYRDQDALAFARRISNGESNGLANDHLVASIAPGTKLVYDSCEYTVLLAGNDNVTVNSSKGPAELSLDMILGLRQQGRLTILSDVDKQQASINEVIRSLSPAEVTRAVERAKMLELVSQGGESKVTRRTLQRWQKAMRESGPENAGRNLALTGLHRNRGNRLAKIPDALVDLISTVAREVYNTPTGVSQEFAYRDFVKRCQSAELVPCSKKTFRIRLNRLSSLRARKGNRAAYQAAPITMYLSASDPVHGDRPFRYVHIDHTPLDVVAKALGYPEPLGRPWLSLAMCSETRAIVGFYLTYDSPSYVSVMMVLRDIVRRHGRLPDTIVTDNGPDFRSESLKRFCALYRVDLRFRPAAKPRHGSVLERVLGTAQTQFIHNLAGNTKLMKHVRTVTKSVRPEQFATWTLPGLHGALDYYFRVIYGEENHPAHGEGPEHYLQRRLSETGTRATRLVALDRTLLIETCPAVDRKGTRTVDFQRGIKVDHLYYWTDMFRAGDWDKKEVQVRVDPWNAGVCYVLLKNEWHKCISKITSTLNSLTRVELRYYYAEMQRRAGVQKRGLTPERIAEWTRLFEVNAFDPRTKAMVDESRFIYERLNMGAVEPTIPGAEGAPMQPQIANGSIQTGSRDKDNNPPLSHENQHIEDDEYAFF